MLGRREQSNRSARCVATHTLLPAWQRAWSTLLLYPDDARLRHAVVHEFAGALREVLDRGAVQVVVAGDGLILDTGQGTLRTPGGDLHRYFREAGISAMCIDPSVETRVLEDLLQLLRDCHPAARTAGEEGAPRHWNGDLPGIILRFTNPHGDAPSTAGVELAALIRTSTPEGIRTAVERERKTNLPLRLGQLLLADLERVPRTDPYHHAGIRALTDLQAVLLSRGELASLGWLCDEIARHTAIAPAERQSIQNALVDGLAEAWSASHQAPGAATDREWTALLMRLPEVVGHRLLAALPPDGRLPGLDPLATVFPEASERAEDAEPVHVMENPKLTCGQEPPTPE